MCNGFLNLCEVSDIITPNFTEAALLLGEKYIEPPYTREYVESTLKKLSKLGPSKIVLTGVSFKDDEVGAACYDKKTQEINYAFVARIVRGISMDKSIEIAVNLVNEAIKITYERGTPTKYGVDFENILPQFIMYI